MKLKLTYFKRSGKYYSDGFYTTQATEYYAAIKEVHELLRTKAAPGLANIWYGPILVSMADDPTGVPHVLNCYQELGYD